MATTFDVFYLGKIVDLDPSGGNTTAENAEKIVGQTFGAAGNPLHTSIYSFAPGDSGYAGGGSADHYDSDNSLAKDQFTIDGGRDRTLDSTVVYDATITYTDGTTAKITAVVFQDADGNAFLAPETEYNADQAALEAKPIQSLTLDAVNDASQELAADRYDGAFSTPDSVDGTSGDDVMRTDYTDMHGDSIDGADGENDTIKGYDGNDAIAGGDGADEIDGGSGDDLLVGDDGADTISGGDGADTIYTGSATAPAAAPQMVGYWTFDDNVAPGDDRSATDNDAAFAGDADVPTASGRLELDGDGDYAVIADDPAYDLDSYTMRIEFTLDTLTARSGLIAKDSSNLSTTEFSIYVEPDGSVVIHSDGGTLSTAAGLVGTGTEHSVQISYDSATGQINFYVDDVVAATSAAGGLSLTGNDNPWVLGATSKASTPGTADSTADHLDGTIDSFTLYDGALTPAEVASPAGDADVVDGGAGDDEIHGDAGADSLSGGDDADTFFVYDYFGDDTITGGEGGTDNDTIDASGVSMPLTLVYTGAESGTISDGVNTISFSEIETVETGSDADVIDATGAGSSGVAVRSGAGDDQVTGSAGNDTIDAGVGADTVSGGDGADVIYGDGVFPTSGTIDASNYTDTTSGFTVTAQNVVGGGQTVASVDNIVLYGGNLGVSGTVTGNDSPTQSQLAYDVTSGLSETLIVDFDTDVTELSFTFAHLYTSSHGEVGHWTIYDDGTLVAEGDFTEDSAGSRTGTVDLSGYGTFDQIVFSSLIQSDLSGGSDYTIAGIDYTTAFASAEGGETLDGGAGDDTISGGGGADVMTGGAGDDTFIFQGGFGNDTVTGGETEEVGGDTLDASALSTPLTVVFTGTDAGTLSDGTHTVTFAEIENITLGSGADSFSAAADTDGVTVDGGAGADTITGGSGADWIESGTGDDSLDGGAGNDTIYYGEGNDTVYGGAGDDVIDDVNMSGYVGVNSLYGGAGNDTIFGGGGDDLIVGGTGADALFGEDDSDTFILEDDFGNDTIDGGGNVSTGIDFDTIDLSAVTVPLTVVYSSQEAGTVTDGVSTASFTDIESLILSAKADVVDATADTAGVDIQAGAGADAVTGGSGADAIDGVAGADTIYGGAGADTISGGDGGDFIYGNDGDDVVYGGNDLDVIFSGQGNDTIHGDGGDDIIIVNGSEASTTKVVGGETGETSGDTLILSGDGSNTTGVAVTYTGDEAGTFDDGTNSGTFSEIERLNTSSGNDTVDASASASGADVETGSGADSVTGGAGADTIDAGSGDDTIAGGAGDDVVTGGYGADTFTFSDGDGADIITDFDLADDDGDGYTNDQLDLTALTASDGSPVNIWDVVVSDTVGDGTGDAILTFPNGESLTLTNVDPAALDLAMMNAMGIPCLAAGTLIDTPEGGRPVEQLRPGDMVNTRGGVAPVTWTARRRLDAANFAAQPRLRPVRIRAGALGNWRDLLVSPQHRIALGPADAPAGFAPARWLADDGDGRFRTAWGCRDVTYVHLLLPEHALIRAEGAWVESFYPGPQGLAALDPAARADLFRQFPALAEIRTKTDAKRAYGPLALREIRRRDLVRFIGVPGRAGQVAQLARIAPHVQPAAPYPGQM